MGLDAAEQKALLEPATPRSEDIGLIAWTKARAEAGAGTLELRTSRTEDYRDIPVIGDPALTLAARTLRERIRRFGKGSAEVISWLQAQDLVFSWEGPDSARLPEPAAASQPLLIQQDRAYQRAAALFYRERYLEALQAFQAVASEQANPWRGWAKFATARIYAKVGGIAGSELDAKGALTNLAELQSDPAFAEIRGDAAALENRIRYQEDPPAFYAQILRHLGEQHRGPGLAQDLEDLRWLRVLEPWTEGLKDVRPSGVHAWIDRLQKGTLDEALAAYDAEPSLPNLVVVMILAATRSSSNGRVPEAGPAGQSKQGPAYATLVSHRLRILVAQKRLKAVKVLADEALAQPGVARWPSAFNLWSDLELAQAPDLNAFAAHLGRRLASIDDGDWTPWSEHPDDDPQDHRSLKALGPAAVELLNRRMPLRLWEELLASNRFPAELKPELLEALWTRAALLGREDVMAHYQPELAKARPTLAKDLAAWSAEHDLARKKALAYLLVWEHRLWPQVLTFRNEAFQYGTIYARWEGPPEPRANSTKAALDGSLVSQEPAPRGLAGYDLQLAAPFLNAAAARAGEAEAAQIPAPLTWFCEQALAFAEAEPEDSLAPRALAQAVRSSRNSNRDARSADLVVKAFRLLHKRYPDSAAAKEARVYH